MKKIPTFLLLCALVAGLTAFTGCKADDNESQPNDFKATGPLADGGIAGSMQGWNEKTVKWTNGSSSVEKYVYEYEFTAEKNEAEWKVLVKKGVWNPAYCSKDNKWWVKVDENAIGLHYDTTGGAPNLFTPNLETGKKYRITVTVEGKTVSASVKKL